MSHPVCADAQGIRCQLKTTREAVTIRNLRPFVPAVVLDDQLALVRRKAQETAARALDRRILQRLGRLTRWAKRIGD